MHRFVKTVFWIAASLMLAAGAAVSLSWAPDRPVSELQARWAPPPSVFVDIGGLQVHLRDEGPRNDPAPIVLLHGTSASLHTWDGWAAVLVAQRRVIRFDLPGFGLTGPFPDGDYRPAHYLRFMGALFDKLGIKNCVLAGNSFGGQIAWLTSLAYPQRVEKLVLVDSAGYPLQPNSVPVGFRIARTPVLNQLMRNMLPRLLVEASVRNVYGDPAKVTPALVDRYYEITLREGNRDALVQRFIQFPSGPDAQRITDLKLPALILWGGRDRLIPPADAERFHRDIAGSTLVVFPALGHVPHEEDPAATAAAVRKFLGLT
ncbi:MAG TPA: alpha/beta hydrolase [Burkholderiales bacterium]|nr:alpha/beta hydrolase [Burkholderiales bacterium]